MELSRMIAQDDLEVRVIEIDEREKRRLHSQLEIRKKIREEKEARRRKEFMR